MLPLVEEGAEALGTVPTSVPQSIEEVRPSLQLQSISLSLCRQDSGGGVSLRPVCLCIDTRLSAAIPSHGCGKLRSKAAAARLMALDAGLCPVVRRPTPERLLFAV